MKDSEERTMNTSSTIAVGVDASWADTSAIDWALQESRFGGSPILAIHVVDNRPPTGPYFTKPDVNHAARRLTAAVSEYLGEHGDQIVHSTEILAAACSW
jgi:nucleotide-binding universal stress UspA family protein